MGSTSPLGIPRHHRERLRGTLPRRERSRPTRVRSLALWNALRGGVHSPRLIQARAAEIKAELEHSFAFSATQAVAVHEVARCTAVLEAIDRELDERGLFAKGGKPSYLLPLRARISRQLEQWLAKIAPAIERPSGRMPRRSPWSDEMCSGGRIVAIYIAAGPGYPMHLRDEVRAVPGRGLEGDRYFTDNGRFSNQRVPGREISELTLIESEVVHHLRLEWGLDVEEADSRRNLVTRGVALNDLVGAEFDVGEVRLRGASLCEPCVSLVKSPEHKHLLRALAHKGGLRAQVLSEGTITLGDPVAVPVLIEAGRLAIARAS